MNNEYTLIKTIDNGNFKEGFENAEMYEFRLNNKVIGHALIKNNTNINNIFININEDYQSNGYGKILFTELLKVLKTKNINEITLDVNNENYKMINIINKTNKEHLTTKNGIKTFLIKL